MKLSRREKFERDTFPHVEALQASALWLTMRWTNAEALVLKTMTKAYRSWHNSPDRSSDKARLFRILVREVSGLGYRRFQNRGYLPENGETAANKDNGHGHHQSESIDRRELSQLTGIPGIYVRAAIARLRPLSRLIMTLLFRERFSHADIGYITDLRDDSVKSILSRLRRLIPRYLLQHAESPVAWRVSPAAFKVRRLLPGKVKRLGPFELPGRIRDELDNDAAARIWENDGGALDSQC